MTISVFGVEHGDVAKGLMGMARALKPAKAKKASEAVNLVFKPMKPGVKPTGPGSMRGQMDPSAWETRMAAKRREV